MSINSNYTTISKIVHHISNPNYPTGALIEEIPADIGRSIEGYKRGGLIEGVEKLRKEVMAAGVWLFGIPLINKLGNAVCEKILKIPMDIDLCKDGQGNNTFKDSFEYLKNGVNSKNLDVSALDKYTTEAFKEKFKTTDIDSLIKTTKTAKMITSLGALGINCFLMGVVLPKYNQKLTQKELDKEKKKAYAPKFDTFEEFTNKTKANKGKELTFKGATNIASFLTNYACSIENNNTTRLISTDIPMIAGRVATSRNKYEALEYIIMDGASIYFYNFCLGHVQNFLRKFSNTPDINPKITEAIINSGDESIKKALSNLDKANNLDELLDNKELTKELYNIGTFGKFGKINKFIKDKDIESIDKGVINFFKFAQEKMGGIFKENGELKKLAKKVNNKNASFMAAGLGVSILGLSVLIPKFTFWVTKTITGKNTFAGITDYNDIEKNK